MPKPLGGAVRLPVSERASVLAAIRRIRAALPVGAIAARDLIVELERKLEAAQADEASETG